MGAVVGSAQAHGASHRRYRFARTLKKLSVSSNALASLPMSIEQLHSLRVLNVSHAVLLLEILWENVHAG